MEYLVTCPQNCKNIQYVDQAFLDFNDDNKKLDNRNSKSLGCEKELDQFANFIYNTIRNEYQLKHFGILSKTKS